MSTKKHTPQPTPAVPATIEPAKQASEIQVSTYRALAMEPARVMSIIRSNAGPQGLSPWDLDRVKVPTGGALNWEVPTIKGPQSAPAIEGIIVQWKDVRAYWDEKYSGGNKPPDCFSNDCLVGTGQPGGPCETCPFAQFGSAVDERGKQTAGQACKQTKMLLLVRETELMPMLLALPSKSLRPMKQYFNRLSSAEIHYFACVTSFKLTRGTSASGIPCSVVQPEFVRELNSEEQQRVLALAAVLRDTFEKAAPAEGEVRGTGD